MIHCIYSPITGTDYQFMSDEELKKSERDHVDRYVKRRQQKRNKRKLK